MFLRDRSGIDADDHHATLHEVVLDILTSGGTSSSRWRFPGRTLSIRPSQWMTHCLCTESRRATSAPRRMALRRQIRQQARIIAQLLRRSGEGDPAAIEHIGLARHLQREVEMLLDHDHRDFPGEVDQSLSDLLDHADPYTLCRLIQQQK